MVIFHCYVSLPEGTDNHLVPSLVDPIAFSPDIPSCGKCSKQIQRLIRGRSESQIQSSQLANHPICAPKFHPHLLIQMKYHKFHLSKTTPPCLPLNSRFKPQEGQRQGQGQIGTGETVPPGGPGSGCWGGADPNLLGDARGSGGREARAAAPHGGLYHYGH